MLGRLIGEDIDLAIVPGADLGQVKADPGQLEQVVMNLCVNARDAMPDGGLLRIETANVELDAGHAARHEPMAPGRYVMLTVSDAGCGIEKEILSKIFEPFFTTKEPGKGTGLGLAMVYGIVKQAGGHVWVDSEVGRGTTFKIYLPRIDEPAVAPRGPEAPMPARGWETILLVEDEGSLRAIAREILEEHGYRVIEAAGAERGASRSPRRHPGAHPPARHRRRDAGDERPGAGRDPWWPRAPSSGCSTCRATPTTSSPTAASWSRAPSCSRSPSPSLALLERVRTALGPDPGRE